MILADTSAWIGYVRGDGTPAALRLRELVDRDDGALVVTAPVEMEVLVGARHPKHEKELRHLLSRGRPLQFDATVTSTRRRASTAAAAASASPPGASWTA